MPMESELTLENVLQIFTAMLEEVKIDSNRETILKEAVQAIQSQIRTESILAELPSMLIEGSGLDMNLAKEAIEFRKTLNSESDRACALMAAAYLELQLEKLIKSFLVEDAPVVNRVLGSSGPFGNFASKIDMAYLLGLIPNLVRRDLHLLRKIRNDFAHTHTQIDFTNPTVASRCHELKYHGLPEAQEPRRKFVRVMMGIMSFTHAKLPITKHAQQMDEPKGENIKAYMGRSTEMLKKLSQEQSHDPELQTILEKIAEGME